MDLESDLDEESDDSDDLEDLESDDDSDDDFDDDGIDELSPAELEAAATVLSTAKAAMIVENFIRESWLG